jgi:hypothetical protein
MCWLVGRLVAYGLRVECEWGGKIQSWHMLPLHLHLLLSRFGNNNRKVKLLLIEVPIKFQAFGGFDCY